MADAKYKAFTEITVRATNMPLIWEHKLYEGFKIRAISYDSKVVRFYTLDGSNTAGSLAFANLVKFYAPCKDQEEGNHG